MSPKTTSDNTETSTGDGNLLSATEGLVSWVSSMKKQYRLQESTIMDLFRIQLMWVEQNVQRQAVKTGQDLVDEIAAEQAERTANEVISSDE